MAWSSTYACCANAKASRVKSALLNRRQGCDQKTQRAAAESRASLEDVKIEDQGNDHDVHGHSDKDHDVCDAFSGM